MAQPDSLSALREHVSKIVMVDTHEHLIPEPDRLNADVDVLATFFPHYASSDLKSAGMPEEELLRIRKATVPLEERWQLFEPWWERIRNTGYARAMEIAVRDLYGEDGINADNYADLSGKIKARNKEGLYRWVLRERSGIEVSINDVLDPEVDTEFFAPVHRFSDFLIVKDRKALETLGRASGGPIHTLKSMVSALRRRFDALEGKIVGVKIGLAYMRPIFFDRVTFSEAEEAFNKIYRRRNLRVNEDPDNWKQIPESVAVEEMRPLQDYIIHEMIREAERRRLPVQIHTGLQEGSRSTRGSRRETRTSSPTRIPSTSSTSSWSTRTPGSTYSTGAGPTAGSWGPSPRTSPTSTSTCVGCTSSAPKEPESPYPTGSTRSPPTRSWASAGTTWWSREYTGTR
jgi:hypothetical protein